MGTVIRADLSKRNRWWIPKHRYYELKHFCMQYPEWRRAKNELILYKNSFARVLNDDGGFGRPTETAAERIAYFDSRLEMVEKAAAMTDDCIGEHILRGVVRGMSYDAMYVSKPIPCCREIYYELYHKFFYILNRLRE